MRRPCLPGFPSTSKKRLWRLLLAAAPAFVFGCANEPVGPQSEAAAPLFAEKDRGKGDKDGTVFVFAGQSCPAGEFVTGFDDSGQIICAAPEPPQEPENTPPTLLNVLVQLNIAGTELHCQAEGVSDAENDPVTVTYRWLRNGIGAGGGQIYDLNVVLPSPEDTFECQVTLDDGTDIAIFVSDPYVIQ